MGPRCGPPRGAGAPDGAFEGRRAAAAARRAREPAKRRVRACRCALSELSCAMSLPPTGNELAERALDERCARPGSASSNAWWRSSQRCLRRIRRTSCRMR